MARSPITALEMRWRPLESGPADDEGTWSVRRFAPGEAVQLVGLRRGVEYAVEARHLGVGALASNWVPVTVTVATSNRTGAAGQLPVASGNVTSRWVSGTAATYTTTATEATISVSAGVLQIGGKQIAYEASSATLAGSADEHKVCYLYYDDLYLAGGERTLGVTTDPVASMAAAGRILITVLEVVFAATGSTGSGGGDIGGGGGGSGTGFHSGGMIP